MGFWGGKPKPDPPSSQTSSDGFGADTHEWGGVPEAADLDAFTDSFEATASDQWADGGAESLPAEGGWGSDEDRTGMAAQPSVAVPILPPQVRLPPRTPADATAGQPSPQVRAPPTLGLAMTICALDGALNFVQGGIIGALFGAFGGLSESAQAGLRGPDRMRHVGSRAWGSAWQFGSWVGTYRGVKCSMVAARGKKDWVNSAVAGGCAGVIPVIRSGNPRLILVTGLGSGLFMGALDSVERLFTPAGKDTS